ncbi:glycoside hydrolase family 3 protein [Nonomuraea sp. NN258]|uniref:glycoside hydrolase family 3 protein n=1 Tax=Nonomuraea antri TaxID=2730852 RepID=UPI001568766B|nr:glycoside hydrolase family 3 protein [Nonomuraea antri]NRQ30979.1 glycoside hydrolase family 3 protein [Nonomuraea antri]
MTSSVSARNLGSPVLAELADTVLQPGFKGTTLPDWVRKRLATGLGGIALYSRNLAEKGQIQLLTAAIRAENPDVIIALDEEGGDVTRLEAFSGSSRPGNLALGAADEPALTEAVARGIGRDLAEVGLNLNYAPVVDIDSALHNPVVGTRAFGSDPELVARHTAAWVSGLQSAGVAGCAKHFPGHGATAVDSHDALPTVELSAAELAATALLPYRAAIAAGVRAIMTGHLLVPAYDAGSPATISARLMTGLLREELGFDGLIVTDGIEMPAVSATYGLGGTAVRALAAGADAICVGGENATPGVVGLLRNSIMAAVADGVLPEERLAEAAGRVRALSAWSAGHPGAPAGEGDAHAAVTAARSALSITINTALTAPGVPHVIELDAPTNLAIDPATPWGLGAPLSALVPGTTAVRLDAPGDAELRQAVDAGAGRPLVLVLRTAYRDARLTAAVDRVLAGRPDAIVVELGVPGGERPGAVHVATFGGTALCCQVAAQALAAMLRT